MAKTSKKKTQPAQPAQSHITELDVHLFREGRHFRLYDKLGSHLTEIDGAPGASFTLWAPNAKAVSLIGDFNGWNPKEHPMNVRWDGSGIWEAFLPNAQQGMIYKYHITSQHRKHIVEKADPFAMHAETPPKTGSVIWDNSYKWSDSDWMKSRSRANALDAPFSIYEIHLGSWRRVPEEQNRSLSYRELATYLPDYLREMGYTHVELLPIMEHPFYGSWGYQTVGYFSPTSRYGTPQDFMHLVDQLHQKGIGVIIDWVPSHFPGDEHGLAYFDGTHLFEHMDKRQGYHPDWHSYIFNYGRNEVRSFLISSALFWLDKYHIDGIRVDAVASMLYLDYSRKEGEWIPNAFGGRENLEAIEFLKQFNHAVYSEYPDVQTIAEESTAWPMVSRPVHLGGLGFGMKWNMGWMHDSLQYFSTDALFRKFKHSQLTFSIWYAFTENFLLSISHDEVTHGKGTFLGKMPGDEWQKHANVRLFYGYMYGHPGKKLQFMGNELGQWREWAHDESLEWNVLDFPLHSGTQQWVKDLNRFYAKEPALFELDFSHDGFQWIDFHDSENSVLTFLRRGKSTDDVILVVCNFTPVSRTNYRVGVPRGGTWTEALNSDATLYAGSGHGNLGAVEASPVAAHGFFHSLSLTVPPLSALFFINKKEKGIS